MLYYFRERSQERFYFLSLLGNVPDGDIMSQDVTILDVARAARLSKSTVSRVLSGNSYGVSSDAVERVEEAVRRLGYVRNTLASSMRTNRSKTILLIIPDITNSFWAEVARGVQDRFDSEGYSVVMANSDWEADRERRYIQLARMNRVDAVLINAPDIDMSELSGVRCPVVLLGERKGRGGFPVVGTDTFGAVTEALEYLYRLGHRDIALVHHDRPDSEGYGSSRLKAFRAFLNGKGLEDREDRIFTVPLVRESGAEIARTLSTMDKRPSAMIAGNDLVAVGFLQEARRNGISVPRDISVIGIDDIPSATMISPALTTIGKPKLEIGRMAAEIVLKMLAGVQVDPVTLLPAQLIIRETTRQREA